MFPASGGLRRALPALALLTGSALVSLVMAELAVRLFAPQPVGLSWLTPDGLLVHIPGRAAVFRRSEYAADVRFNALGFRGREFVAPKPAGTFRVLALGDSFVEGLQVGEDAVLTARIEAAFAGSVPRVEVLDLGVSGYGTTEAIDVLERYGPSLGPDLVVLFFCLQNDVRNNVEGRCRLDGGRLVCGERPIPSHLGLLGSHVNSLAATHSQLYQALRSAASSSLLQRIGVRSEEATQSMPGMPFADDQYLAGQPAYLADGMALTGALLAKLREIARELGAETWMVLVPGRTQVEDARWASVEATFGADHVRRDQPQRELSRLGAQAGIPVIDLLPAFRARDARGERLYWKIDAHFNAAGHDEAARVVAEALRPRLADGPDAERARGLRPPAGAEAPAPPW